MWNTSQLFTPPETYAAPGFSAPGVRSLFFDGLPYRGRPTRVFAWVGVPPAPAGQRLPGMVLIHGGGGSAIAEWVRIWNRRGYAAIAMDTTGHVPTGDATRWSGHSNLRNPHPHGGPNGWGGLDQLDAPVEDQWSYHAVGAVIRAHSLLASLPEVDPARIGVTGVSWGGYLTCIAAGVDPRFAFAAPVYGCGFLGENSCWLPDFAKLGPARAAKWLGLWDPSVHVRHARMPLLWVTGTNDFAYPLDSFQKTYRLPPAPRTLAVRVRMVHAHGGAGEYPPEIHGFANSLLRDEPPLLRITGHGCAGAQAWTTFDTAVPLDHAELIFTRGTGRWFDHHWESLPAATDGHRVSAVLPADASVWYFNLYDARQFAVSSEHVVA